MKDEKICKGGVKEQCKNRRSAAEELLLERKAAGAVLGTLKSFRRKLEENRSGS